MMIADILLQHPIRRAASKRARASLALGFLAGLAWTTAAAATLPTSLEVAVDDPRPLAAVADELERRFGIAVSYEDPPYSDPADLVYSKVAEGVLIPAGSGLTVEYGYDDVEGTGPMLDPLSILQAFVQQHEAKDQPGRFRVEEEDGMYFIIPERVRQGKAGLVAVTPVLDAVVGVPLAQPASAMSRLEEIVDGVALATGAEIRLGMIPGNLLTETTVTLEGGALSAREHLAALSAALPNPVTWRLLYDYDRQTYYLNLAIVPGANTPVLTVEPPPQDSLSINPKAGGGG